MTIALLATAASAGAQVFTAYANPTGAQLSLATAVSDANSTGAGTYNTIVLTPGRYLPATGLTINGNLTITGDHSNQTASGGGTYEIDGSNQQGQSPPTDFITIASGANVTIEGVQIQAAGDFSNGFNAALADHGNLSLYSDALTSETGYPVHIDGTGKALIVDTLFDSTIHTASVRLESGSATLVNDTIANGTGNGIETNGGTFTLHNTLLAFNAGIECVGGTSTEPSGTQDGSLDDDGSCGVQHSADTSVDTGFPITGTNGGPTASDLTSFPSTELRGNPSDCPTVDQRFFVNPFTVNLGVRTTSCDIGATTNSATRETSSQAPQCGAPSAFYPSGYPNLSPSAYAANPATQTVPVSDGFSGFGPEAGSPGDPLNGADSVAGVINASNVAPGGIANGSVALLSPFSAPAPGSESVKATKATEGVRSAWSFTATDWAGLSTYCN